MAPAAVRFHLQQQLVESLRLGDRRYARSRRRAKPPEILVFTFIIRKSWLGQVGGEGNFEIVEEPAGCFLEGLEPEEERLWAESLLFLLLRVGGGIEGQ
jgi:hypothetical protein